jgi:solute carrier family 35, member F1/2
MYTPLCGYLIYHFRYKNSNVYTAIPIWKFFLASAVDVHATVLIVYAYTQTSITSVMVVEDFSIPSALVLSLCWLRISYHRVHYIAICVCCCGIAVGFVNDFLHLEDAGQGEHPILGDLMALSGAFLYALENVI